MKKIITVVIIVLFIPVISQAALRVPVKTAPLQPLPQNTAPNVDSNINTPGNDLNTNQQQIEEQRQQGEEQQDSQTPDEEQQATTIADAKAAATSTSHYWIVFFVGLVGLLGAIIWGFIRFVRKP